MVAQGLVVRMTELHCSIEGAEGEGVPKAQTTIGLAVLVEFRQRTARSSPLTPVSGRQIGVPDSVGF